MYRLARLYTQDVFRFPPPVLLDIQTPCTFIWKPVPEETAVRSSVPLALRRRLPRVGLLQGVRPIGLGGDGARGGHAGVYDVGRSSGVCVDYFFCAGSEIDTRAFLKLERLGTFSISLCGI